MGVGRDSGKQERWGTTRSKMDLFTGMNRGKYKEHKTPDGLDALTRHCEILMQKLEIKSKGCRDVETIDGRVKKRTKISCEV